MKTLKIGIASPKKYKERTMAIARGEYKPKDDEPKIWFTSIESVAKILSEKNRALLSFIASENPSSIQELSEKTGRAKSNLSRTLKTMSNYGIISLEKGEGRAIVPKSKYNNFSLELSIDPTQKAA